MTILDQEFVCQFAAIGRAWMSGDERGTLATATLYPPSPAKLSGDPTKVSVELPNPVEPFQHGEHYRVIIERVPK